MPFFTRSVSVYTFYCEKPKVVNAPIAECSSQKPANEKETGKFSRPAVPFSREISRDAFASDDEDELVAVSPPQPRVRIDFSKVRLLEKSPSIDYENSSEVIVGSEDMWREPEDTEVPRAVPRPSGIYDHLPWPPVPCGSLFEAPYDKNGEPEDAVITRDQALGFTTKAKYLHFPTSGQTFMVHRKVSYDVTAYWDARDGFERFPKPQNQVRLEKYREIELKTNGGQPLPDQQTREVNNQVSTAIHEEVLWDINECIRRKRKHEGSEEPDAKRPRFGPMQLRTIKKRGLVFSATEYDDEEEQKVLPYLCGYRKRRC